LRPSPEQNSQEYGQQCAPQEEGDDGLNIDEVGKATD
jgi:hypothetical protein